MAWLAVVVPLTLMWNVIMLSGMLGSRVNAPWPRRVLTAIQVVLFAAGLATVLLYDVLVANAHTKGEIFVASWSVSGPALLAGTLLTYLEYLVAGRRGDFLSDLTRMRWFGR